MNILQINTEGSTNYKLFGLIKKIRIQTEIVYEKETKAKKIADIKIYFLNILIKHTRDYRWYSHIDVTKSSFGFK